MAKKQNGGGELVPQQQPNTDVALPGDLIGRLAAFAKQAQATEAVKGKFFTTRAGQLAFGGNAIPNNSMEVVVIRSMHERVYYPEKWNPENMQSPLCFSYSFTGEGMVPHDNATQKQSTNCAECVHNKWAKDPVDGKNRKACKEQRRLALMPATALEKAEFVKDATVGYARVPVTSVKHWSEYAQKIAATGLPTFAVVTKVGLVPDAKNQFRYTFDAVHKITDPATIEELLARYEAEAAPMTVPYDKRSEGNGNGADATPAQPAQPTAAPAGVKF